MDVTQVATLVNSITSEKLGQSAILETDLSNVVDVGNAIFDNMSYDVFTKSLIDRITRILFVDRKYVGALAKLKREQFEYGIKEKIYLTELPVAVDDDAWSLTDNTTYNQDTFKQPSAAALFYQHQNNFRIDISVAEKQVKTAFASATELNSFVSMLFNQVDNSLEIKMEGLSEATVATLAANVIYDDIPDLDPSKTGIKAVNLLKLYNDQFDHQGNDPLKAAEALFTPEFIRFAVLVISEYTDRLKKASTLFNIGGLVRFTPKDKQELLLLSKFKKAADVYLQSDTFNEEYTALPMSESVAYWQGSGTDYSLDSISKIHVDIKDPADATKTIDVEFGGILGVLFDYEAAGIDNEERSVSSHVNAAALFTNYFYHQSCRNWIDGNEQAVVFFIGEKTTP
jgi:hypothetical protein